MTGIETTIFQIYNTLITEAMLVLFFASLKCLCVLIVDLTGTYLELS